MEESCQQRWVCPHGGARMEAGDTWIDRPSGSTCHCVQVYTFTNLEIHTLEPFLYI